MKMFARLRVAWVEEPENHLLGWQGESSIFRQLHLVYVQDFSLICDSCLQHKLISKNSVILTQIFSICHFTLFFSIMMVMHAATAIYCLCTFSHVCLIRLPLESPPCVLFFYIGFLMKSYWVVAEDSLRETCRSCKDYLDQRYPSTPTMHRTFPGKVILKDGWWACSIFQKLR